MKYVYETYSNKTNKNKTRDLFPPAWTLHASLHFTISLIRKNTILGHRTSGITTVNATFHGVTTSPQSFSGEDNMLSGRVVTSRFLTDLIFMCFILILRLNDASASGKCDITSLRWWKWDVQLLFERKCIMFMLNNYLSKFNTYFGINCFVSIKL